MILKRREKKVNSVLSTHGKLCSALPHFLLLRHLVTVALKPWLWLRCTAAAGGHGGTGRGATLFRDTKSPPPTIRKVRPKFHPLGSTAWVC